MWSSRQRVESEDAAPGILARISAALEAARGLAATRAAMFKEEASEKGSTLARGAAAMAIALALGFFALMLLTALVAVLLAQLFGSVWAGVLGALVLYLIAAAGAAFAGIRSFRGFRLLDFPETRRGLREDWAAVRGSLQPPPEPAEDSEDLEQRFRAGAE